MYENLGKIQTKYERIPGFFQKRIVNTVLICMVLLYCGCTFGMAEESTGFVLWTLYLVVCGFLYAGYIFYLAVTGCYEIVQGTVIKMQKELPIDHLRVVQVQAEDGSVTELLLDKRTEVKVGKTYRFYFNSTVPSLSMIQRLDASFSLGSFWGLEKVKEVLFVRFWHGSTPCRPVSMYQLHGKYKKRRELYVRNKTGNRKVVQRKERVRFYYRRGWNRLFRPLFPDSDGWFSESFWKRIGTV